MILKKGHDLIAFAAQEIQAGNIKHSRNFAKVLKDEYLLLKNTRRGILITGLRSTGKTIGVLQAITAFPSDNIIYISPSSREDSLTKDEVLEMLKATNYDLIFLDEYSWMKDDNSGKDPLAAYLAGKAQEGIKVIITGTDSTKIHGLLNTEFIHRAVQLNTTYFSYDEYCRLYELDKNDSSMKDFLTCGGIFENHACKTYGSMKDYIKTAIVENLGAYYPQYESSVIEAAVYKIFYECICKSYTKNAGKIPVFNNGRNNRLAYADFLENFGIRTDIEIKQNVLREIFYKLNEIGVVVVLNNIAYNNRERAYITNQTISAQLTKCVYEVNELPETYIGDLFEASVVCHAYMQYAYDKNSPFEMYYAETKRSTLEIDFILCDKRKAYLFECKLNDNSNMKLNNTASILQDSVSDLLGDREAAGRYVIYQGKEKAVKQKDCTVVFTNNWDIDFSDFSRHIERLKNTDNILCR